MRGNVLAENSNGTEASASRLNSTTSSANGANFYFLEIEDGSEIVQAIKDAHHKAFSLCEEQNFSPKWAGQELMEVDSSAGKVRDIFVVPVFRGPVFEHLVKQKCRVYGPPHVIQCIMREEILVRIDHPLYSSCMLNVVATVSGLNKEKMQIGRYVQYMGGIYRGSLLDSTTHVITDREHANSKKCQICVTDTPRRILITADWVYKCWENLDLQLKDASACCLEIMKDFVLPFSGLTVTTSGYGTGERKEFQQVVEKGGGTFSGQLKRGFNTHLIIEKDSGEKFLKAQEWGDIQCVKKQWLFDCAEQCITLPENMYFTGANLSCNSRSISTPVSSQAPRLNDPDVSNIPGLPNMTINSNTSLESRAHSQVSKLSCRAHKLKLKKQLSPVRDDSGSKRSSGSVARVRNAGETPMPLDVTNANRNSDQPVYNIDPAVFDDLEEPAPANGSLPPTVDENGAAACSMHAEEEPVQQQDNDKTNKDDNDDANSYLPVFENMTLGIVGFADDVEYGYDALKTEIESCKGTVLSGGVVDYLVVPIFVNNINHSEFVKFQPKEIVTNAWLQICCDLGELSELSTDPLFRPLLCADLTATPLTGCVLCISGIDGPRRDTIAHIAAMLGANFQETMVKSDCVVGGDQFWKTTHLIVDSPQGSKYDAAIKWKILALSVNWIIDCFQHGEKLNENEYRVDRNPPLRKGPAGIEWLNRPPPANPRLNALRRSSAFSPARSVVGSPVAKSTPNMSRGNEQGSTAGTSMIDSPGQFLNSGFQPRFDIAGADKVIANSGTPQKEFWQTSGHTDESLSSFVANQIAAGAERVLNGQVQVHDKSLTDRRSDEQKRIDRDNLNAARAGRHLRAVSTPYRSDPSPVVQRPVASQTLTPITPHTVDGPLNGVVICVSRKLLGMQDSLFKQIKKLGGDYKHMIEPGATHFIYKGSVSEECGELYKAQAVNAIVVSPDWLNECEREGKLLDEKMFQPTGDVFKRPSLAADNGSAKRKSSEVSEENSSVFNPPSSKRSNVETPARQEDLTSGPSEDDRQVVGADRVAPAVPQDTTPKEKEDPLREKKAQLLQLMDGARQKRNDSRRSSQSSNATSPVKMPPIPASTSSLRRSSRLRSDRTSDILNTPNMLVWEDQKESSVPPRATSNEPSQSYNLRPDEIEEIPQMNVLPQDTMDSLDEFQMDEPEEGQKVPDAYIFMFTNTNANIRAKCTEIIERLGGSVVDSDKFENDITHLIAETPSRSEKYLSSIANGKWMVHPSYLEECSREGKFIAEDDYEWGSDALFKRLGHTKQKELALAGKKWRTAIMRENRGPLSGWKVILYMETQKLESIRRLLVHGGAELVITRSELDFEDGVPIFPSLTHALIEEKKCKDWTQNQGDFDILVEKRVPCYETKYLINYLLNSDSIDHESHLLANYKNSIKK